MVQAQILWEVRKGEPFGPIAEWLIPLDEHGRPTWGEAGMGAMLPKRVVYEEPDTPFPVRPEDFLDPTFEFAFSHLGPALFAISLMHCKNVDLRSVDPPERLSRKHERKTGRPLTRYYVLDIEPMRSVLDREGQAQTEGPPPCTAHLPGPLQDLHRGRAAVRKAHRHVLVGLAGSAARPSTGSWRRTTASASTTALPILR